MRTNRTSVGRISRTVVLVVAVGAAVMSMAPFAGAQEAPLTAVVNGNPMCAQAGQASRVRIAIRPKAEILDTNTIHVTDLSTDPNQRLHLTNVDGAPNAWIAPTDSACLHS